MEKMKILILFIFVFIVKVNALVSSEAATMIELKNILKELSRDWDEEDPCHWNGARGSIMCSNESVVSIAVFHDPPLEATSSIPSSIGLLSNLVTLELIGYGFQGTIPSEILNISSLRTLDFSGNYLNGTIGTQFNNLKKLSTLRLSKNLLSGSIDSSLFESIPNLEVLDLKTNRLLGYIPSSIGSCKSLKAIKLGENELTGTIPSEIGNLSDLIVLNLARNHLTGQIPMSISNLDSLTTLLLSDNHLSDPVPWTDIFQLYSLQNCSLNNNPEIHCWSNLCCNPESETETFQNPTAHAETNSESMSPTTTAPPPPFTTEQPSIVPVGEKSGVSKQLPFWLQGNFQLIFVLTLVALSVFCVCLIFVHAHRRRHNGHVTYNQIPQQI